MCFDAIIGVWFSRKNSFWNVCHYVEIKRSERILSFFPPKWRGGRSVSVRGSVGLTVVSLVPACDFITKTGHYRKPKWPCWKMIWKSIPVFIPPCLCACVRVCCVSHSRNCTAGNETTESSVIPPFSPDLYMKETGKEGWEREGVRFEPNVFCPQTSPVAVGLKCRVATAFPATTSSTWETRVAKMRVPSQTVQRTPGGDLPCSSCCSCSQWRCGYRGSTRPSPDPPFPTLPLPQSCLPLPPRSTTRPSTFQNHDITLIAFLSQRHQR